MEKIIDLIIATCDEMKAHDIRAYHVTETSALTDYVIVLSVATSIHIKAIQESLLKLFKETLKDKVTIDFHAHPVVSGQADSGWVAVDMNSCILHIMEEETRKTYALDELFQDRGVAYYH